MERISILDCTLRDGGYVNDWSFGKKYIENTVSLLEQSDIDIIEIGFLKDEFYDENRTVFNDIRQIKKFISEKKCNSLYATMIEVVNPIPLEMLSERTDGSVDIVRVIVWKTKKNKDGEIVDALDEGYEYCKGIVTKGYRLCVQPARTDQYTDDEFVAMIKKFQQLNPMAIYIVDSWGTMDAEEVLHYMKLADDNLNENIAIGYHGHNNLMQAYGNACQVVNYHTDREVIIDASIYGIGRGAGNLNTELFAKYLNEKKEKKYDIVPLMEIYENVIKKIRSEHFWGYSIYYYLTAMYGCNPNYANYYGIEKKLKPKVVESILRKLDTMDKIIFSRGIAERWLEIEMRE